MRITSTQLDRGILFAYLKWVHQQLVEIRTNYILQTQFYAVKDVETMPFTGTEHLKTFL